MKKEQLLLEDKSEETNELQVKEVARLLNLKEKPKVRIIDFEKDSFFLMKARDQREFLHKQLDLNFLDYPSLLITNEGKK